MKNHWLDKKNEVAEEVARKIEEVFRQRMLKEVRQFLESDDYFEKVDTDVTAQRHSQA